MINNWFSGTDASTTISLPSTLSFNLLGTYNYDPWTRFFFGPGISRGDLEMTSGTTAGTIGLTGSFSQQLIAPGFMLGAAFSFAPHLILQISDQYVSYPTVSWTSKEPISGAEVNGSYQLTTNRVLVSLIKQF
jgi:hypothetical protein